MWFAGVHEKQDEDSSDTPIQEFTITTLSIEVKCNYKDGYEKSCFEVAPYSLDSTPMCERHLHIRMKALMALALKVGKKVILSYKIRGS